MHAAVVREEGQAPAYGEFEEPRTEAGEILVSVLAAGVSNLTLSRAAGGHYSGASSPPFVVGADGVGTTPDGRRVYFSFPRAPFGSMAERVPYRAEGLLELPRELDPAVAAGAAIPGASSWLPLTRLARPRPGESVLVNGATGASGHLAVQVARHLGADRVIATGRNHAELDELAKLGVEHRVKIEPDLRGFRDAIRTLARELRTGIVLDYLWGPTAEAIVSALGGPDGPRGPERVRFVQIGAMSGGTISLPSAPLRASGLEILGSGLGSYPLPDTRAAIGEFLRAIPSAGFRLNVATHPLAEVGQFWGATGGAHRIVFMVP